VLSIMLRKTAIGLAAAALAMGGLTLNASAMRGGGDCGPHGAGGLHRRWLRTRRRRLWAACGFAMRGTDLGTTIGAGAAVAATSYGGSRWRWTPEGRVWVCGGGDGYGPSYRYQSWRCHRGGRVFWDAQWRAALPLSENGLSNSPALGAGEHEVCSASRRIQRGPCKFFGIFELRLGAKRAAIFAKKSVLITD
jgi:hypothetical protein